MLYELDISGRSTWVGEVRTLICNLGFGEAWEFQQVGSEQLFLNEVKNTLTNRFNENWYNTIQENGRLKDYCKHKSFFRR
jgi:hypothetical protein